jgi:hypothetical protein
MMRCTNCESEIPEGEKFCPHCGVPVGVLVKCPHCDAALLPGERFCGECGRDVTTATADAAEDAAAGTGETVGRGAPSATAAAKAKRPTWFWIAIGAGALLIVACIAVCSLTALPSILATPTPTPSPTPTSTPTPTPTPEPAVQAGMLLVKETFDQVPEGWDLGNVSDVEYALQDGQYSIKVVQEQWMAWQYLGEEWGDFVVEVETTLIEGEIYNSSGIFFRYQDRDNFYSLDINGNGKYTVGKEVEGEYSDIIDWTSSGALAPLGSPNVIRLVAYGNTFTLYINDQYVDTFTDTDFNSGDIAVKVTAYDTPPARATFDNLSVWDAELR